jgi:hypothetical protein
LGLEGNEGPSNKSGGSELALGELAEKERAANLWILAQFEMQSHCPSGPEDLDFFLCPICWCSAACGGDLAAGSRGRVV